MKIQRQSKQSIRENKNFKINEERKKIINLTPPPIEFSKNK